MVPSWVGKIHWRRDRLPTPVFLGFPCGSAGRESACNAGDLGWEYPLEKGKATHSSILPGEFMDYSPWGHKELDMTEQFSLSLDQVFKINLNRVICEQYSEIGVPNIVIIVIWVRLPDLAKI